jgi:hypothetical protein
LGGWGATVTSERDAVSHLPIPEAIDRLEAETPVASGRPRPGVLPRRVPVLEGLGQPEDTPHPPDLHDRAARVAANGSRKAQERVFGDGLGLIAYRAVIRP